MNNNKQGNISEKCGFVRIFIEGDDITINENVTKIYYPI